MSVRRQAFLKTGAAAFGEAGIEEILDQLHDGLTLGAQQLGIEGQIGAVNLQLVTDVPERYKDVNIFGKHSTGNITIAFNEGAPLQTVIDGAKRVGVHEVAHKAHFLKAAGNNDWGQGDAFSVLIKEGIATHIEFTLVDEDYWPLNLLNTPNDVRDRYEDVLIRALFGMASDDGELRIFTDESDLNKYIIGTYVVGLFAVTRDIAPCDLIAVSFDEFRDFAQTEL